MHEQLDRLVRFIARIVTTLWFRDVEIVGRDRVPPSGPVLVVASHFNGLLDPMLVAATSSRVPRFLAKSTLWRNPVAAWVLDLVGAVPVYRPSEGSTRRNVEVFAASNQALAAGDAVALFPEGTTHDEPRIARVRTGAARIALGARQAGVRGVVIVPVGIVYTAKASPRSRALVRIGRPIHLDRDIDAFIPPGTDAGPGNADAVRHLTREIRRRLAEAALDYEDAGFALMAAQAASVALRPPGAPRYWLPSLDDVERCARALAASSVNAQQAVTERFLPYHNALILLGLTDADVAGGLRPRDVRWRVGTLGAVAAVAPAAVVGAAVNAPAVAAVWAAGHLPWSTPMRGTGRVLAGITAFPATWAALRWELGQKPLREPTLATLVVGPGCGLVALALVERVRALRSARESVTRLREHPGILPALVEEREALVAAVRAAVTTQNDDRTLRTA